MHLRVSNDYTHLNLPEIRETLEKISSEQVVEFSHEEGAAWLRWRAPEEGKHKSVSVSIPIHWMNEEEFASAVRESTRNFATVILLPK